MNEIQPILDLLSQKLPWLLPALAWLGAIKLALLAFEGKIARYAADKLNEVAATESEDDDQFLRELFARKSYRTAQVVLLLMSVRLPTLADLERAIKLQKEAK